MKRAGRGRLLRPHQVREAVRLRRLGLGISALAEHLGIHRETARGYLAPHGLTRRRPTPLVMLEDLRGAQRLDLARRILDLDELLRVSAPDRTLATLERIRGVPFHRQHARWFRECGLIGVHVTHYEFRGEALLEFSDERKARTVLSPKVVEAALRIRVRFEARRRVRGS